MERDCDLHNPDYLLYDLVVSGQAVGFDNLVSEPKADGVEPKSAKTQGETVQKHCSSLHHLLESLVTLGAVSDLFGFCQAMSKNSSARMAEKILS